MPKLIAIVLILVGAVGGGAGGYFAKQMLAGGGAEEAEGGEKDGHGKTAGDAHKDGHSDDGHGGKDAKHAEAKKSAGHGSHGAMDGKAGKPAKKAPKDDGHGGKGGDSYDLNDGRNYFKFSRQFVVPIVAEEGVKSLVVIDLNLEMDSDAAERFYVREPKLRDALMIELLDIANEGRFSGVLTDRRNLELVRVDLLNAVQDVEGEVVHDVLIQDIMRQDL